MFKQLNKLSIFDLNKLYKLKFVYSALNNLLPKCLNTFFPLNSTLHVHKTRHFDKLFIRPVSTTFRKLFVVDSALILWNELPDNITSSNSLPILSSACKKNIYSKFHKSRYICWLISHLHSLLYIVDLLFTNCLNNITGCNASVEVRWLFLYFLYMLCVFVLIALIWY